MDNPTRMKLYTATRKVMSPLQCITSILLDGGPSNAWLDANAAELVHVLDRLEQEASAICAKLRETVREESRGKHA